MSIKQKNTTKSLDLYTTRCLSKKFSKTTQINYIFLCLIINYTVTNNHIGCVFTDSLQFFVNPTHIKAGRLGIPAQHH